MTLLEALELVKRPIGEPLYTQTILLECGFTPLHLLTFLSAHLRQSFPDDRIAIHTGLYGDLVSNLERIEPAGASVVCVIAEWTDLDSRLGIRSLGSWRLADLPDIVASARRQSERLAQRISRLAETMPVYLSTPTLPLPPIFSTNGCQAHQAQCQLREIAASLAMSVSACQRARVIDVQRLDEVSPPGRRFDPKAPTAWNTPRASPNSSPR